MDEVRKKKTVGRFRADRQPSINIFLWAIALLSHAACKSFGGLFAARFVLGMCEGAITPGFMIVSTISLYTPLLIADVASGNRNVLHPQRADAEDRILVCVFHSYRSFLSIPSDARSQFSRMVPPSSSRVCSLSAASTSEPLGSSHGNGW